GLALLILSLEAALVHQDRLFAGCVLALNGVAIGVAGLARRSERSLFAGGLVQSLSTSLAVWHFHLADPFGDWGILLFQLDGITLALVVIAWLWLDPFVRQQVAAQGEWKNWLSWMVFLCYLTLIIPLAMVAVLICFDPFDVPSYLTEAVTAWPGWLHLIVVL